MYQPQSGDMSVMTHRRHATSKGDIPSRFPLETARFLSSPQKRARIVWTRASTANVRRPKMAALGPRLTHKARILYTPHQKSEVLSGSGSFEACTVHRDHTDFAFRPYFVVLNQVRSGIILLHETGRSSPSDSRTPNPAPSVFNLRDCTRGTALR